MRALLEMPGWGWLLFAAAALAYPAACVACLSARGRGVGRSADVLFRTALMMLGAGVGAGLGVMILSDMSGGLAAGIRDYPLVLPLGVVWGMLLVGGEAVFMNPWAPDSKPAAICMLDGMLVAVALALLVCAFVPPLWWDPAGNARLALIAVVAAEVGAAGGLVVRLVTRP